MFWCNINLQALTAAQLECAPCNKCVARSKLDYPFRRDLTTSESLVEALKKYIEDNTPYKGIGPEAVKNPDLRIIDIRHDNRLVCRVEAKLLEGFAFMKAEQILGDHLKPKETIVVDEPKLLSYFECKENDLKKFTRDVPIYVVWKFDRPCADVGGIAIFQEVTVLKSIYTSRGKNRAFTRKTVASDIVNGQQRGITAKYHFSLKECRPIEELIPAILSIK